MAATRRCRRLFSRPRSHDEASYLLVLEALSLLVVSCSTQLYSTSTAAPPGAHPLADALMEQKVGRRAKTLRQALRLGVSGESGFE
jgi:hypothetical protein